jgi:hypothetical protein
MAGYGDKAVPRSVKFAQDLGDGVEGAGASPWDKVLGYSSRDAESWQ